MNVGPPKETLDVGQPRRYGVVGQITTLPIIVYNFHTLFLVTILTNLLILPAQQE